MIEFVEIMDFQSHKHSSIDFDKGVNIIAGASDSGKSSILRALLWVIRNRPTGDSICNWFSDEVTVVNITTPECSVVKSRSKGETIFDFLEGEDHHVFKKVKTDVPEEIQRALNISDVNIQEQHDAYFLLKDSPGEVARKLNEITGLDIIDSLFKHANKEILDTKRLIENKEVDLKEINEEIEGFLYVDKALERVQALLTKMEKFREKHSKFSEVSKCVSSFTTQKEAERGYEEWLLIKGKFEKLQKKLFHYDSVCEKYHLIEQIIEDAHNNEKRKGILMKELEKTRIEWRDLLSEGMICPTCGQEIDVETLEKILNETPYMR
jgi:exonuclease SbcC